MNDPREFVREQVAERTSGSDPWTGKPIVAQEASKQSDDAFKAAVKTAVDELVAEGELFFWAGLIATADEETLQTIIRQERESEIPRKLLIGKANRVLGGER